MLNELGAPPEKDQDAIALQLIAQARPDVRTKEVKRVIAEWRAYADLEQEPDWDD